MAVSTETINKMNRLSAENLSIVISLVDNLSKSPLDMFDELRAEAQKNPMTDEEIDEFVSRARVSSTY